LNDKLFRRLVWAAFITTALLIVVGGVVRISDSGLGCGPEGAGLHGWPLCEGRILPILDANQLVEYGHRFLASIVGLLSLAVAWFAWRRHREEPFVAPLAIAAAIGVIAEGVLGGLTVEHGLESALVATHLGLSMLILAAFAGLLLVTGEADDDSAPVRVSRWPLIVAPSAVWFTIVAGGYVAGTEKFGTPADDRAGGGGAHMACGDEFPTCLGQWFPFGESTAVDTLLTHQVLMYLTIGAVAWLVVAVLRNCPAGLPRTLAIVSGSLLACQVLLGAINIWAGVHRGLILGHLVLGTAVWLSVALTAITAWRAGTIRSA
jgi:heme A synthase